MAIPVNNSYINLASLEVGANTPVTAAQDKLTGDGNTSLTQATSTNTANQGVATTTLPTSSLVLPAIEDTLYNDYFPALKNFYIVEILSNSESFKDNTDMLNSYIKFHATNVNFGDETLSLDRNNVTKNFQVRDNGYQRSDKLTITWRESDDWRVKRYHENWMNLFYDRNLDMYRSCATDADRDRLYRTFRITLYTGFDHSTGSASGNFEFANARALNKNSDAPDTITCSPGKSIIFKDVIPSNIGSLNLEWGTSPGLVTHQFSYYVKDWDWEDQNV